MGRTYLPSAASVASMAARAGSGSEAHFCCHFESRAGRSSRVSARARAVPPRPRSAVHGRQHGEESEGATSTRAGTGRGRRECGRSWARERPMDRVWISGIVITLLVLGVWCLVFGVLGGNRSLNKPSGRLVDHSSSDVQRLLESSCVWCVRESFRSSKIKVGTAQARAGLTCSAKPGLNCRLAGVGLESWMRTGPCKCLALHCCNGQAFVHCPLLVLCCPFLASIKPIFNSSSFSFDSAGRFLIPLDSRFYGRMTFE